MSSPHNGRVRCRLVTNYLGRGLFLIQYRMYGNYLDVSLSVTHETHVPGSPYFLGAMFHEDCVCPLQSPGEWLSHFQCQEVEGQIAEDLEPFRSGGVNVTHLYESVGQVYSKSSFIYYSIVNGKVSRSEVF